MVERQLSSDFFCILFDEFEGPNSAGNLLLGTGTFSAEPNGVGHTQLTPLGNVAITINKDNCNDEGENVFAALETLQHELIHVKMINALRNFGYNGLPSTIEEAFIEMLNINYGENASQAQHRFMLDYFFDQMVNSLMEINGSGNYSDFLGLVLNGIPSSVLEASGFNLDDVAGMVEHSRDYLQEESNINEVLLECAN